MPTKMKIKIKDNSELRARINELYEKTSQVDLARAILIAKHILSIADIDYH